MKLSRILRPVIAFVAAIAAGVTGALIAAQFATAPADILVAPLTQVAPVIEPVSFGPGSPEGDPFDVSRALANTEIALGGDGADEVTRRLLDDLTESDDPGDAGGASIAPYDPAAPSGSSAGDDDGDPCAPREGAAAEDCPEGLHSTVLALVAPENPYYVIASANPPTYADSPYKLVYCDAQSHDEFSLPIGVATNAPSTISFTYWPSGDPSDVRELSIETTAADRAAWESGLAAATGFSGVWTRPQHCLVVEGLEKYVTYRAHFEATDILGRTDAYDWGFMLPDDRTVPPTRVLPLSDNILFVSAPHVPSQDVEVRAWHVAAGEDASCANPAATSAGLEALQEQRTTEVGADYLERNGYLSQYTQRTSAAYWVPEGSTILVCIRWTNPDRPSWDWGTSIRQYEQVLQSPDRTVPVVSLAGVSLVRTVGAEAVTVSGRTREGFRCGGWVGPDTETDTIELPADLPVVCAPFAGTSSRGDVVVTAAVSQGDNETTQSSVLPLSREACRGACALPETSWYRLTLPTIRVGTGLCGSSFGACDPPTAEVAAGSALLRVDWSQGNTNGQTGWATGLASEGAPDRPRPDAPQMNTFEELTATPAGATGAYNLGFRLQTDRPVTYSIHLFGECATDGLIRDVTGTSTGVAMINFGRVCLGAEYRAEVELTDEAGNRSLWTQTPGPNFWPYGFASTPLRETNLNVSYTISRPGSDILTYVSPLSITVSGARVTRSPSQPCIAGTSVTVNNQLVRDLPLGDRITVAVSIAMHTAYGSATGADADCDSSEYDGETLSFETVITRAQLTSLEGVTITAPPGSPYSVTIVIHGA